MTWSLVVNRVVPFGSGLSAGVLHLRAYAAPARPPTLIVAEFDWALMVADRRDAYVGAGIWTYPLRALGAARAEVRRASYGEAGIVVVRLPSPAGERYERVALDDDPQGWEAVDLDWVRGRLPGAPVAAFPPGAYTQRAIEAWIARSG